MKQIVGLLLLASTIGLVIAATSSASTNVETSCAALEAALKADVAAALKAARAHDGPAEVRISKAIIALTATYKTACAGSSSNAPPEFSSSTDVATIGKPYGPVTFCPHPAGKYCNDAAGKRITFHLFGVFLPLGMRFDAFSGTISGTPRVGQSPRDVPLHVCWYELGGPDHCFDTTLFLRK